MDFAASWAHLDNWRDVFTLLADAVERYARRESPMSIVVFLDELPWLATPRSGLLRALDYVWNTRLSRVPCLRMILCGSAASWILEKLVRAKGGLHNRLTRRMRLEPFRLGEAKEFLEARRVRSSIEETLDLYLAVGGVPHYLKMMERGLSARENIAQSCFSENAPLREEFSLVFSALFAHAEEHEALVRAMAKRRAGLTRTELHELTGTRSGGRFARRLAELEEAGFAASTPAYRAATKNTLYRLVDEYTWFYLKWIEPAPAGAFGRTGKAYWMSKASGRSFGAWAGYAFEALCLKHAPELVRALDIESVATEVSSWRSPTSRDAADAPGAQIDLLIEQEDGIVHVCELKFSSEPYSIGAEYARLLRRKVDVFRSKTRTRKRVLLTLVTPYGLVPNKWSDELVDRSVTAEALFQ